MRKLAVVALTMGAVACTALSELGALMRPPRFEEAPDRPAEFRLLGPTGSSGYGGAGIRLWAKVSNPNPFGLTLSTLRGTLFLEDSRAATAEFPLGLPLSAGGETIVPIDLSVNFSELPDMVDVVRRAVSRQPIQYRFDGTIGVDAGRFGAPVFGPMTLLRGTVRRAGPSREVVVGSK